MGGNGEKLGGVEGENFKTVVRIYEVRRKKFFNIRKHGFAFA